MTRHLECKDWSKKRKLKLKTGFLIIKTLKNELNKQNLIKYEESKSSHF